MLVAAGCSSDSGDKEKKDSGSSASSSAAPDSPEPEATVEPAKFTQLPDPCKSISAKTIKSLIPGAKPKGGTAAKSSDLSSRAGCSWNGLDDKGVKGSQYHWLDVGFTRFDSDQTLGSGAERAGEDFTKQVTKAKAAEGAKNVAEAPVTGIGEQASRITYDLTKTGEDFKYATIVARTGNVVITLTYNGTGYAGAATPSAGTITKGAETAAKAAVAAVAGVQQDTPSEPTKSGEPAKSSESAKPGESAKPDDKAESGTSAKPSETATATKSG